MQRVLSFEDSPSLSGPMRFFLGAPLFALAAAALLLWQGDAALASRWAMPTLALTHLMTLGFLAMIMCGALLQILPVVAGVVVLRPELTSKIVCHALAAGTILLVAGFILTQPLLFRIAGLALGLALFWMLASVGTGLLRRMPSGTSATAGAVRLALFALAVTAGLGLTLVAGFGWSLSLPLIQLTDAHAAWGLIGWVGLLLIGVAFQVIPMFQVTPVYPRPITIWLPVLLAGLLIAWSLAQFFGLAASAARSLLATLIAAALAAFALTTLALLHKRKRPAETTTLFWRLSMASLLGCAILYVLPGFADDRARPFMLGILFIVGCASSAVNGMLYKIVPFLLWYHLQSRSGLDRKSVPNIKALLPDHAARQQFLLHVCALALLLGAALAPHWLARPAALAFGISSLRLWLNLVHAALIYRRAAALPKSALVAS